MTLSKRGQTFILYGVAIFAVGVGLYLWVSKDSDTNKKAAENNNTLNSTNATVEDLSRAVHDLQADHDGQDALLTCLFNILAEKQVVTKVEIEGCVITTAVPPKQTDGGIAPSGQEGFSSQSGGSQDTSTSSSSNDTSNTPTTQPENPQTPEEPQSIIPFVGEPILGCPIGRFCL